jgi:hypothetical protein
MVLTHLQMSHLSFANEPFPPTFFYQSPPKNCFWTKLSLMERIVTYPYQFGRYLSFTCMNTFSKKSGQKILDRIESGGWNLFLLFPIWKEIANRNHYYPSKTFSEKSDQAEFDSYLVWCFNTFLDQHNVSKISVWQKKCLFLLTQ